VTPLPAGDLPAALAALIADPGRLERADTAAAAALGAGWRLCRPSGWRCLSTTRDRGRCAAGSCPGREDGRVVAFEGARPPSPPAGRSRPLRRRSSATRSRRSSRRASATTWPRPPPRSPSTRRSPPTSSTPPCAARGSPTSSTSGWTSTCRRPPRPRPGERAALEALGTLAVRGPGRGPRRPGPGPALRRAGAAAHPDPGPHGGDRRRPRPGGARSLDREFGAELARLGGGRSTWTSATTSTSAAPSSSSRSSSTSSTCRRGGAPRRATRPTRPCSRSCGRPIRWSASCSTGASTPSSAGTYVQALPSLLADDGRLHNGLHQAVAATGRLSSSDPNLQNIPIRTDLGRRIRRAFVAGGPDVILVPPTTARSSCGSSPTSRATSTSRRPSPRAGTSIATAPPSSCARTRPTSPRTSARWPRWSTSGSPTG